MKNIRIKNYILISMILVVTISLCLLASAYIYYYGNREYKTVKELAASNSKSIADIMADEGMGSVESDEKLLYRIENAIELQKGRILIVDRNYKILVDTDNKSKDSYLVSKNVMSIMKGDLENINHDKKGENIIITPIIVKGDNIEGVLIYRVSLEDVHKTVANQIKVSLVILLIMIIIDGLIISFISKRSVRDINNINEKIMHTALGNFQDRLPEDEGFIEAQVLSENYNEVLDKLSIIDQTRSEFVSNVSHELKTPITSMKVLAESITQNETANVDDYKEFMVDIVDEIDRETKIINDLLTLVRTDSNKNEMNFEDADINDMMESIIKTVNPLANARGITLSYDSFKEVTAKVDAVKLSLAISNLIENAVKYNIDNGWIKCSLNADNKYFYIKVADSGVGIPDDAKDRVFDRFYRVDKARSRDTGGTGLGLSITRSIVNAHKGTIKLYSESGKGTTFTVRIPIEGR